MTAPERGGGHRPAAGRLDDEQTQPSVRGDERESVPVGDQRSDPITGLPGRHGGAQDRKPAGRRLQVRARPREEGTDLSLQDHRRAPGIQQAVGPPERSGQRGGSLVLGNRYALSTQIRFEQVGEELSALPRRPRLELRRGFGPGEPP